ncbi:sphingolipid delta(4)-desaturase DES1-like protein [Dinothrombium tinctorium]|uniref:sphingolipid 4-desaturase n=1 Tax=Dinothrombium tinctorium TaxID=1965070 RepID=A0A443QWE7_9ACAR|nr:sphingolipid delta(4)-desaturase DES1-like protein [Dinothrombium tinctorium]
MGAKVSRADFTWVGSDEPHATRRRLILEKHPEVKKLMRTDPSFKWLVTSLVTIQILSLFFISRIESFAILFLLSYCFTGVINHSLTLAIHEISHRQAFGQTAVLSNKLFGIFANLPLAIPMFVAFKNYHLEHHVYLSVDMLDPDLPTEFETKVFTTTFTKLIFVILQPLFYTLRPLFRRYKPPTAMDMLNIVVQLLFNILVGTIFGWHVVVYLFFSTLIALGLHPLTGHFISEHYIMHEDEPRVKNPNLEQIPDSLVPQTYSYYGPLNLITFNVGYHVEHHDFPSIPASKLPMLKRMAPEFYDNLHYHTSWVKVLYQYVTDPRAGPYARSKRPYQEPFLDKFKRN